jgi:hypothetical protein
MQAAGQAETAKSADILLDQALCSGARSIGIATCADKAILPLAEAARLGNQAGHNSDHL